MNPLEAKIKKSEIDSESECSEDSASLSKLKLEAYRQCYEENVKIHLPRSVLNYFADDARAVGCTHGHWNRLHFHQCCLFRDVCSETRDTKTGMRKRVKIILDLQSL